MLGAVLICAIGAGAFWAYQSHLKTKEATLACIATAFPYVLMEHKRSELSGLLEDMHIEEGEDPHMHEVEEAMKGNKKPPTKFFLSEEIDTQMLKISEDLQNKGPGSFSSEQMIKLFMDLEGLFNSQAQGYITECRSLFKTIMSECGSFDNTTEQDQACRDKYDDQVTTMLRKHIQ